MILRRTAGVTIALATALAAPAAGFGAPSAADRIAAAPDAPAMPGGTAPRSGPAPDAAPDAGDGGGTLSDQLARQKGTLTPPGNIDPGIHAPVPPVGQSKMPVIPPPGSSGSNAPVQPK